MLIPKADFNCCLFIFAATSRPAAQQQLSLVSTITADLEASARKGAQGFVFFIGNLQLQGPVSLNPVVGQRGLGSKCLSLPRKQRDQRGVAGKQTVRAHEYWSHGSCQK